MKWFKHDSDAHSDAKLKKVLIKYGAQGYGLYWYCLECIAKDISEHNLTFELEHDAEILAHEGKMDSRIVEEIMLYMVDLGLFESNSGHITCMKMLKRLDQSMTSNPTMRKVISGAKIMTHPDGVMTESAKPMQDKIRLDKIRLEKNKTSSSPAAQNDPIPVAKIIDLYHQKLPTLPKVQKITQARASVIQQRWREDMPNLDNWGNFFDHVSQSDFLMGRVEPRDGRQVFIANLEWITKASNFTKILEGKYNGI